MSAWRKEPPTYREWRDAKNHGVWWVKFLLSPEKVIENEDGNPAFFKEAWYTDVVTITASYSNGFKHLRQELKGEEPDYSGIKLHARGGVVGSFDLDNPDQLKDVYWQPVAPPKDDEKDNRPKVN